MLRRVYDSDRCRVLVRDECSGAVEREDDRSRPRGGFHLADDLECLRIDGKYFVRSLARDVDLAAIRPHRHAFGFLANLDAFANRAAGNVEYRHLGRFLVGNIKRFSVRQQIEGFRVLAALKRAHELSRGEIDDADSVSLRSAGGSFDSSTPGPAMGDPESATSNVVPSCEVRIPRGRLPTAIRSST